MKSTVYKKIMIATDGSELVRKAVDSAIEISKFSEAKLYATYVIAVGGYSISPYIDAEWEKAMRETSGKKVRKQRLMSKTLVEPQMLRSNPLF